jgi:hypothetical protein
MFPPDEIHNRRENMPQSDSIFTPMTEIFKMPFYYASLTTFKVYFKVQTSRMLPFLTGTGLNPAVFSDDPSGETGYASIEFQNYTGHGGMLLETCNEVEFNAIAYPQVRANDVPLMPFREFVLGQEQTKNIGYMRLYVPADNKFAVQAGQTLFGEPKFYTNFFYNVPACNNPGVSKWQYSVLDPKYKPPQDPTQKPPVSAVIYTINGDLNGLDPLPGNASPVTLYGMFPNKKIPGRKGYKTGRLAGSRWNILGSDQTYFLEKNSKRIQLTYGGSKYPMGADIKFLLGSPAEAVAVQTFQSAPAAVENRAWYADIP